MRHVPRLGACGFDKAPSPLQLIRLGVYCAGRNAPSQCEMVTGPSFSSSRQPDKERATAYRASSGPDSRLDVAYCATIIGNWEGLYRGISVQTGEYHNGTVRRNLMR